MNTPHRVHDRLAVALALLLFTAGACAPPPEEQTEGALCGAVDVEGEPYHLVPETSRFVVVVHKSDASFGCAVAHSHVVRASGATLSGSVSGAPDNSALVLTVSAAALVPDDAALRTELLEEWEADPVAASDIPSIRQSVLDELDATKHPTLTFTLRNVAAAEGDSSGTLQAEIAGATADVPVAFHAARTGDGIAVSGTVTLNGAPFGIPRSPLGFCVNPALTVHFTLTLAAGDATCSAPADVVAPFVPTLFPDDGCAEHVGFNRARDVLGRRCVGCHMDGPARGGASAPLVTWEDLRANSARHPDAPLYLTAHALMNTDPALGLAMPTEDASPLVEPSPEAPDLMDERALLTTWMVDDAGRNAACSDDPGPTAFAAIAHKSCDDANNFSTGDDGDYEDDLVSSPQEFFVRSCMGCHGAQDDAPAAPQLGAFVEEPMRLTTIDFRAALLPGAHPYYATAAGERLSFWEMSTLRVDDYSMPPGASPDPARHRRDYANDPGYLIFKAWVDNGFAEGPCP